LLLMLHRPLLTVLLFALILRLSYGLVQDHRLGYEISGDDSTWYLALGYALVTDFETGYLAGYGEDVYPDGYPIALRALPTPPLYLLFVGSPQVVLPREVAVAAIRVLQALLGTATVYLAYRLARHLAGHGGAGLVVAGVLAISPALVVETAQIATETLYIFLVLAALTVYIEREASPASVVFSAVLLGLATLTRAVLLLFPIGLAVHLLLVYGWRRGGARAVLLLVVYTLVVGSWTAYNLIRWDRLVIGGEGFAAFLYIGATESGWQGGAAVDEALQANGDLPADSSQQQETYLENAGALISRDPLGYVQRRITQLAEAYLLPHGTLVFGGASLRRLVVDWLQTDRTVPGLFQLVQAPGFWPKLALYAFHFTGLVAGIGGLWRLRGRWRGVLPLVGFIAYVTLLHLFLEAIPRYIFPAMIVWWVLAGGLWARQPRTSPTVQPAAHENYSTGSP
jgi:4-amino-4-deoxy-L-arabinose transferase-like glycosyltransferase